MSVISLETVILDTDIPLALDLALRFSYQQLMISKALDLEYLSWL